MTIVFQAYTESPIPEPVSTIPAADLIDRAAILLQDITNDRWTRAEMLGWLNEGQRQIVMLQPTASARVAICRLVVGSKQTIPSGGWMLLDVTRNMGPDGDTPGRAIRIVSRKLLDAQNLEWHFATADPVVQNYVFTQKDGGSVFYVYPPSNGFNCVELSYSRTPMDVETEDKFIDIHAMYQNALVDYMVYRAASKDAEHAPMQAFAQMYLESFRATMADKSNSESTGNVNQIMKDPV